MIYSFVHPELFRQSEPEQTPAADSNPPADPNAGAQTSAPAPDPAPAARLKGNPAQIKGALKKISDAGELARVRAAEASAETPREAVLAAIDARAAELAG